MFDALDVSRYIIWYYDRRGGGISNLKMQKIMYFAQAQFLVSFGVPLFSEEIVATGFGPVVSSVYKRYLPYGNASIPVWNNGTEPALKKKLNRRQRKLLDGLLDKCFPYQQSDLLNIVMQQKPFREAYEQGDSTGISLVSLRDFFAE